MVGTGFAKNINEAVNSNQKTIKAVEERIKL
jgi:hypothetical protein